MLPKNTNGRLIPPTMLVMMMKMIKAKNVHFVFSTVTEILLKDLLVNYEYLYYDLQGFEAEPP